MPKTILTKINTLLSLICISVNAFAQQPVIDKLNQVIKPIQTLNPEASFQDIGFLEQVLKEREVISLGEATHGSKELYAYKDRLIRYLVTQLDFKAIAIEADYNRMEVIDDYINGKIERTPISANYKPLFTWLRNYNQNQKEQNKVHLYGLEIREFNPAIDKILATNKGLSQKDKNILLAIQRQPFNEIDKESLTDFKAVCSRLPENLHKKMLMQLIDNYYPLTSTNSKIGLRDRLMSENAIAIKEIAENKKLIIWAHNGHIAKTSLYGKPAMGEYLFKHYREKYYAIATDINKGNVRVRKFIAKNKPVSDWQPLYYPEVTNKDSYEYYFKQCRFKNFILEVHPPGIDSELLSFLMKKKQMRMIGALSIPVNKKLSIAENFDMIVYFDQTTST